jgi:hypothetical protein
MVRHRIVNPPRKQLGVRVPPLQPISKDELVISKLIESGCLPLEGTFEITNSIIDMFYDTYHNLFGRSENKACTKGNIRYAKKLAGFSLIKLNKSRLEKVSWVSGRLKINSGIFYIISNPAFTGYVKVGITKDLKSRLNVYQTYDPHRGFKVEHYLFVENVREVERLVLEKYQTKTTKNGEWVEAEKAKQIFKYVNAGLV